MTTDITSVKATFTIVVETYSVVDGEQVTRLRLEGARFRPPLHANPQLTDRLLAGMGARLSTHASQLTAHAH